MANDLNWLDEMSIAEDKYAALAKLAGCKEWVATEARETVRFHFAMTLAHELERSRGGKKALARALKVAAAGCDRVLGDYVKLVGLSMPTAEQISAVDTWARSERQKFNEGYAA